MSTLYEYYITGDSSDSFFCDIYWSTQTFTPSVDFTITSIKLLLWNSRGLYEGDVIISIKATDLDSKPTGDDLCSATFTATLLPTSSPGEWYEIIFSSEYDLTAETKYAIVARAPDADCFVEMVGWRLDVDDPGYTDGRAWWSEDGGSSWIDYGVEEDYMFEVWGLGPSVGRDIQSITAVRRIAGGNDFPYSFPFRFNATTTGRSMQTHTGRNIQTHTGRFLAGDNSFPYEFPFRFNVTITGRTVNM